MKNCTPLWREAHSQVKKLKHTRVGPLFLVEMSKKCTPLWREARLQVKMYKTPGSGALLEVGMSKNCTPLWREAHFQVKMYKTPQRRTTFGSCDVEKVHAVVAQSTFASQNVQNTPRSDHFWKLRCRKSACRCGAKHVSKSKCENTTCSRHFWTLRWRFAWQVQGIAHVVKREQNVRVFWHFQKRWQAQYKRHMSQTC